MWKFTYLRGRAKQARNTYGTGRCGRRLIFAPTDVSLQSFFGQCLYEVSRTAIVSALTSLSAKQTNLWNYDMNTGMNLKYMMNDLINFDLFLAINGEGRPQKMSFRAFEMGLRRKRDHTSMLVSNVKGPDLTDGRCVALPSTVANYYTHHSHCNELSRAGLHPWISMISMHTTKTTLSQHVLWSVYWQTVSI